MDAADILVCHWFALKSSGSDGVGMEHLAHIVPGALHQHDNPGHLDAAASGPRAGTDKHNDHQNTF